MSPEEVPVDSVSEDKDEVVDETFKAPLPSSKSTSTVEADEQKGVPSPLTDLNPPPNEFYIEVLRNGVIVDRIEVTKNCYVFGRSREIDVPLDHPSISRFHAALLWSPDDADDSRPAAPCGVLYLQDLHSVHGTILNKERVESGKLIRLRPGNCVVKFGGSTRLYMVGQSSFVEDEEEAYSPELTSKASEQKDDREEGCCWGMKDDHVSQEGEDEERPSPVATMLEKLQEFSSSKQQEVTTKNQLAYASNPQTCLAKWFEGEGYEFEYRVDYRNNKFICTFKLPVDDQDIIVDGTAMLKKKEAIADACLKCCQLLDEAEILFPWQQQQRQQSSRYNFDNHSDDDDLLDETIEAENKKAKREAAKDTSSESNYETFDSLSKKWSDLSMQLTQTKAKMAAVMTVKTKPELKVEPGDDSLDTYMDSIKKDQNRSNTIGLKIQKSKLKIKIAELERQQKKVERLIRIAKPSFSFPEVKPQQRPIRPKEDIRKIIELMKQNQQLVLTTSKPNDISIDEKPSVASRPSENLKHVVDPKDGQEKADVEQSHTKVEFKMKKPDLLKHKSVFEDQVSQPSARKVLKPSSPPPSSMGSSSSHQGVGSLLNSMKSSQNKKEDKKKRPTYLNSDAYIEWMPPVNQLGDGNTSLNQRFGY